MSYEVPEPVKLRLLKYGSLSTGPAGAANAIAVSAAASPILYWLEESADEEEFERRCAALTLQYQNALAARWAGKPEEFIDSARVLRDWVAADTGIEIEAFTGLDARA